MQQQLPFHQPIDIEAVIGYTDWSTEPPRMVGWWDTRMSFDNGGAVVGRRWWDGTQWSAHVDADDPPHLAEKCKLIISQRQKGIEHRGLRARHPDHYPYRLFMRTKNPTLKKRPVG